MTMEKFQPEDFTTTLSPSNNSNPYKIEQMAFQSLFFVLILLCNLTVLIGLGIQTYRGSKLTSMKLLILNLAVCDLCVGIMDILTDVIHASLDRFHGNDAACKTMQYLEVTFMYSSTYMIVALSLDRLDAILRPLRFTGRVFRAKMLALTAWLLSLLFAIPLLVFSAIVTKPGSVPECRIDFYSPRNWRIYVILLVLAVFLLPALIITTSCLLIVRTIWKNNSRTALTLGTTSGRLEAQTSVSPEHQSQQKSNRGTAKERNCGATERDKKDTRSSSSTTSSLYSKAKLRSLRITFLIVIVFIFCWSPYFIFSVLDVFGRIPDRSSPRMRAVGIFIMSLAPLNSLANPIIYGLCTARICRRPAASPKNRSHAPVSSVAKSAKR